MLENISANYLMDAAHSLQNIAGNHLIEGIKPTSPSRCKHKYCCGINKHDQPAGKKLLKHESLQVRMRTLEEVVLLVYARGPCKMQHWLRG